MTVAEREATEIRLNQHLPIDQPVIFERGAGGGPVPWGGAPVQAEGTIAGDPFRFRFRMNRASLTVYEPGPDREAVLTASEDDVYPGEDYAGVFDTSEDMIACFVRLTRALAPVHPLRNPTPVQRMESGVLRIQLSKAEDFAAEEAVFTERPDSEVAQAAYPNWLALPEVAEWVAAGRPTHATR